MFVQKSVICCVEKNRNTSLKHTRVEFSASCFWRCRLRVGNFVGCNQQLVLAKYYTLVGWLQSDPPPRVSVSDSLRMTRWWGYCYTLYWGGTFTPPVIKCAFQYNNENQNKMQCLITKINKFISSSDITFFYVLNSSCWGTFILKNKTASNENPIFDLDNVSMWFSSLLKWTVSVIVLLRFCNPPVTFGIWQPGSSA